MQKILKTIALYLSKKRRAFLPKAKKVQPGTFLSNRANLIYFCMVCGFIGLSIRAAIIHIFPPASNTLSHIADRQYNRQWELARYRGTIFDRRKEPLAISIRTPSIFVNPKIFNPTPRQLANLSLHLQISKKQLVKISKKKKYFSWVKRKVSKEIARKVLGLDIDGLYQVSEPARYYPAGNAAANLLGFVGIDDRGLTGVEQQYDKVLAGSPIKFVQTKDAKGQTIFSQSEDAAPEKTGDRIYLTIDKVIQEITEQSLRDGVEAAKAKGGFAIVSDPHTGRILAVANHPTFDPNDPRQINLKYVKNRAFMDSFEPGSVIKPYVIGAALDAKTIQLSNSFDCNEGKLKIGRRTINDAHKPKSKFLSVEDIIVHSSNVCTYKIANKLGSKRLYKYFVNLGFGQRLNTSGYPGEATGILSNYNNWKPIRFANISFGQGLMVSGLQIVQAYAAIANGGNLIKPYYLDRIEKPNGMMNNVHSTLNVGRVMTTKTARILRNILYKTIENGATKARSEIYTAGGKTGTSQKIDPKTRRYSHSKHLSSFAGIAPINDPHLVVYVQLDEPNQPLSYGSLWAAPIFKEITEKTLSYLNVASDRASDKSKLLKLSEGKKNGQPRKKL